MEKLRYLSLGGCLSNGYIFGKINVISLAEENYVRNKWSEKMNYLFNWKK